MALGKKPRKPRVCKLCTHPQRDVILESIRIGLPNRRLESIWNVPKATVYYCATTHHGWVSGTQNPHSVPSPELQAVLDAHPEVTLVAPRRPLNLTLPDYTATAETHEGRIARGNDLILTLEALLKSKAGVNDAHFAQMSGLYLKALDVMREWTTQPATQTPSVQITLTQSDEWTRVKQVLVGALKPYPEAARAVAQALEEAGLS